MTGSHPRSRKKTHKACQSNRPELVRLWMLRILIQLGAIKVFIGRRGFSDESLAFYLGLHKWLDREDYFYDPFDPDWVNDEFYQTGRGQDFDKNQIYNELNREYQKLEKQAEYLGSSDVIDKNMGRLSSLIGLSCLECRILEFFIVLSTNKLLEETTDMLGDLTTIELIKSLSVIFAEPETEIGEALSKRGSLFSSGLLTLEKSGPYRMSRMASLFSRDFADHFVSSETDPIDLIRGRVLLSEKTELSLSDFEHLKQGLSLLLPYLKEILASKRKGVNILIHGVPGTGKTQLVKAVAHELDCKLYEVSCEDSDGDPIDGSSRLKAYRAAQCFFSKSRSLLLFDEFEDIVNENEWIGRRVRNEKTSKAWLNRMLEENAIPTFWISNSVWWLDKAFTRRFDIILEVPVPPKSVRKRIISQTTKGFLTETAIDRFATCDYLAPAIVDRAASVINTVKCKLDDTQIEPAYKQLVNSTLKTQGYKPISIDGADQLPSTYSPDYINTDIDLERLVSGVTQTRSARICLYGPPGTGKTAFAKWLAKELDVSLLVKRGSDLISMWVGETEKNIARAFEEAEADGALLLIDEVDSFLQDRRGHQGSGYVITD